MARKKSAAEVLVRQLVEANEWPEPELLEQIVGLGGAAVPAIVAELRPAQPPTRGYLLGLLTVLPGGGAVDELVGLLREAVPEELLPRAIVAQGAAAVAPLLELVRGDRLQGFDRGLAAQLALACAEDRQPVCVALRELLRGLLDRGDALSTDERALAVSLVFDLAQVPDREAEPLLRRAVRAGVSELTSERELNELLAAPPTDPEEPLDWLEEYRERYDEHGYDEFDATEG